MRFPIVVVLAATTTAVASPPARSAPAPRFDAIAFFTGHTEGVGRMKIMLGPHRDVRVHGRGHVLPDGTLVLDQTVDREGRPPSSREWRIRPIAGDRYAGTLSDARGPMHGQGVGDRLHLAYKGKNGVAIEQWLTLAPDGRSAHNRLIARKIGLVVARLDETIRKVD